MDPYGFHRYGKAKWLQASSDVYSIQFQALQRALAWQNPPPQGSQKGAVSASTGSNAPAYRLSRVEQASSSGPQHATMPEPMPPHDVSISASLQGPSFPLPPEPIEQKQSVQDSTRWNPSDEVSHHDFETAFVDSLLADSPYSPQRLATTAQQQFHHEPTQQLTGDLSDIFMTRTALRHQDAEPSRTTGAAASLHMADSVMDEEGQSSQANYPPPSQASLSAPRSNLLDEEAYRAYIERRRVARDRLRKAGWNQARAIRYFDHISRKKGKAPAAFQSFKIVDPPARDTKGLRKSKKLVLYVVPRDDTLRNRINSMVFANRLKWVDVDQGPFLKKDLRQRGPIRFPSKELPFVVDDQSRRNDERVLMTTHGPPFRRLKERRGDIPDGKMFYQFWGFPKDWGMSERTTIEHHGIGYLEDEDIEAVDKHLREMEKIAATANHPPL